MNYYEPPQRPVIDCHPARLGLSITNQAAEPSLIMLAPSLLHLLFLISSAPHFVDVRESTHLTHFMLSCTPCPLSPLGFIASFRLYPHPLLLHYRRHFSLTWTAHPGSRSTEPTNSCDRTEITNFVQLCRLLGA